MRREQLPDEQPPAVRWLPFQLNPDLPEQGVPRSEYMARKFGPGAVRSHAHVEGIGREVGIAFAFDKITVQPNTLNAHRLQIYAAKHGREDDMAERLFRAHFEEGRTIADKSVLADIGEEAGLGRSALEAYLESDEDNDAVAQSDIEARQAGVSGVPFFVFNRRIGVSGAHEPDTLLQAMRECLKEEKV